MKQKGESTTTQLQDEIQGLRYFQRLTIKFNCIYRFNIGCINIVDKHPIHSR